MMANDESTFVTSRRHSFALKCDARVFDKSIVYT
jgi:hypothetical protein